MKYDRFDKENYDFNDLKDIVHFLRQPEGCPWDRAQDYKSMRKCVTDEAGEVVEAVDNDDIINLQEELGDLLLQVLMYAEIAEERGDFTLADVTDEISKKLIRRHPNVFEEIEEHPEDDKEMLSLWKRIKIKEKQDRLKEYEKMYSEGKIKLELLEKQREKVRIYLDEIR